MAQFVVKMQILESIYLPTVERIDNIINVNTNLEKGP